MQTDPLGTLIRFEVATDGICDHGVQFRERISLRRDTATPLWRIPPRDITTCFRARFNMKGDLAHVPRLMFARKGVNWAKNAGIIQPLRDFRNIRAITR
jgi:hypothetical protein